MHLKCRQGNLPNYTAGEKMKLGFNYITFKKQIIKNSKVQLILVGDKFKLAKYVKIIFMEKSSHWDG